MSFGTHRKKILVVDDDADIANSTASVLRALGHSARAITDPRAVLPSVSTDIPDIVLLDIGMPHIDGYEVAKALKRTFPDLCVVAVTAYEGSDHRQRGREAGFDAYLVKPVDISILESVLATLFGPRVVR